VKTGDFKRKRGEPIERVIRKKWRGDDSDKSFVPKKKRAVLSKRVNGK